GSRPTSTRRGRSPWSWSSSSSPSPLAGLGGIVADGSDRRGSPDGSSRRLRAESIGRSPPRRVEEDRPGDVLLEDGPQVPVGPEPPHGGPAPRGQDHEPSEGPRPQGDVGGTVQEQPAAE